jgi:hypothetical protein
MCKSGMTYLLSNVVSVTCSQENCSPFVKQQSITHYTEYVFMTFAISTYCTEITNCSKNYTMIIWFNLYFVLNIVHYMYGIFTFGQHRWCNG